MFKEKNRVGEKYTTNEGYEVEIIEYFNFRNCTIKFKDNFNIVINNIDLGNLKKGKVKNPYHPSIFNIGYSGIGRHSKYKNYKESVVYTTWCNLIRRVHSEKSLLKNPTYKEISLCEEWYNFQNFGDWFEDNYNPETMQGWELDKDILVKGNKIYSPETCCFVPQEINKLFIKSNKSRGEYPIGVHKTKNKFLAQSYSKNKRYLGSFNSVEEAFQAYKIAKKLYIKEVADKWKGQISDKVYQAMYNYKVEIDD